MVSGHGSRIFDFRVSWEVTYLPNSRISRFTSQPVHGLKVANERLPCIPPRSMGTLRLLLFRWGLIFYFSLFCTNFHGKLSYSNWSFYYTLLLLSAIGDVVLELKNPLAQA